MYPRPASYNLMHIGLGYPKGDCHLVQGVAMSPHKSNSHDPSLGQSGKSILRPARNMDTLPAFRHSIGIVVLNSPNKQVVRVYTWAIVASMTNKHAIRYLALVQKIGQPMGKLLTISPIAIEGDIPLPNPTVGRFLDSLKKLVGTGRSDKLGLHRASLSLGAIPRLLQQRGVSLYPSVPHGIHCVTQKAIA